MRKKLPAEENPGTKVSLPWGPRLANHSLASAIPVPMLNPPHCHLKPEAPEKSASSIYKYQPSAHYLLVGTFVLHIEHKYMATGLSSIHFDTNQK